MLIAFSLIVTTRQYVGNPIDCVHTKDIPEDVLNTYCWIHSTVSFKIIVPVADFDYLKLLIILYKNNYASEKFSEIFCNILLCINMFSYRQYALKSMFLKKLGREVPYPGVGNSEGKTEDRKTYKYYQWVCFCLFFQVKP